jgi:hypothetical protein
MIPRCYLVVRKSRDGNLLHVFAVWMDRESAQACADNANEWYGNLHPLTPLTVLGNDALFEPKPFPVEAMRGET